MLSLILINLLFLICMIFYGYLGDKELSESIDNSLTDEDITVCIICMERKKDTVFLCGYMVCYVCGESLRNCYMCRRVIIKKILIYL